MKPKTVEAFDGYVRATEAQMAEQLRLGHPFFIVDQLPEEKRDAVYAKLRQGELQINRLKTRQDGKSIEVPDGLVHHWVGIAFIPGATLRRTLAVL